MKSFSLAAVLSVGSFELAKATDYNGKMKYFIADISTTSPCHPKYERTFTWVDTSNGDAMDFVLDGLVDAGFNGIRLPMWPEDERVRGPDPSNELRDIGRDFCEGINRNWIERIRTANSDQKYADLIVYLSPGLDNKTFQEDFSHSKYASWVVDYITEYEPSYVSPFSANDSTLRSQKFSSSSQMSDTVTMWEMETLKKIKSKKAFKNLNDRPQIIGPDRASVDHTVNVLESFSGSDANRPKYKSRVDIVGTQSRYTDPSATESNFNNLSQNGLGSAWCTLCSQEWYRQIDSSLGYNALRASQVPSGYWANYKEYWGLAQAPASQALAGNLQGFVAEAAIPRFVSKQGTVNTERNWSVFDRMVDSDSNRNNFDLLASTENRNILKPLAGFRESLLDPVDTNKCKVYGSGIDRVLSAYDSCSFEITERDYFNNKYEPIRLYVDTPRSVYAYIETCKTSGQQLCDTQEYYVGVEYLMKYAPGWYVRILFENDTNESNIFQIEALTASGEILGAFQSIFALSTGALALLSSVFLF